MHALSRITARRSTAAVLATAAVAISATGAVSADLDGAEAEVTVAGEGQPLDVGRIRVVDGLSPGGSYRLPAFRIRNHRAVRTGFRLVAFAHARQAERRPPRSWLRFVPPAAVIDPGRSHPIAVHLELPRGAEPGLYSVRVRTRPGDSAGARLTFRIEEAESTRAGLAEPATLASRVVPALTGVLLVIILVARRRTDGKRPSSLPT